MIVELIVMIKVTFGYNNDMNLNGSFEGIEKYNGKYITVINYQGIDMLITEVIDSYIGNNGDIDVREIAQNFYADGSYVNYSNQAKSEICKKLEDYLNSKKIKEEIKQGEPIIEILKKEGLVISDSRPHSIINENKIIPNCVVSIRPELFEELKTVVKNGGKSIFSMYKEIEMLREEIIEIQDNAIKRSI